VDSKDYFAILLEGFLCSQFGSNILTTLFLLWDPRGVIFLGNFVPTKYFTFPISTMVNLFNCYLIAVAHMPPLIFYSSILFYGFYLLPAILRELHVGSNNYRMRVKIRSPEQIQHVFRCLQIPQSNIFQAFGIFLAVLNALYMLIIQYCNYILLKYWDRLDNVPRLLFIGWTLFSIVFWPSLLDLGRYMTMKCCKVLGSWNNLNFKNLRDKKQMSKFRRSCKPLVFSYGNQFTVGRKSVLVFCKGVVRGIFRALLATKH